MTARAPGHDDTAVPTHEAPPGGPPDAALYTEALAARRSLLVALERDKRRLFWLALASALYGVVATAVNGFLLNEQKAFVYRVDQAAGVNTVTFLEPELTLAKGQVVQAMRDWLFQARAVGIDPVMNARLLDAARGRLLGPARAAFERGVAARPAGTDWVVDVDRGSMAGAELTGGDGTYWSWVWRWRETTLYRLEPREERQMIATLVLRLAPPGDMDLVTGANVDGVWVAQFDVGVEARRPLGQAAAGGPG